MVINSEIFHESHGVSCYATEQKHSGANNLIDTNRTSSQHFMCRFSLLHPMKKKLSFVYLSADASSEFGIFPVFVNLNFHTQNWSSILIHTLTRSFICIFKLNVKDSTIRNWPSFQNTQAHAHSGWHSRGEKVYIFHHT